MSGETEVKEVAEEQTDEQAQASLAEGFEQGPNPPAADAAAEGAGTTTGTEDDPDGRKEVEVEYVQVSKQDFDRIMAALPKAEAIDGEIRKLNGTIGNVKADLINRVQALTPSGEAVDLSDEDFAELAADFPELAGHTKTALGRVLKRMNVRGTGQAPAPAEVPQDKIDEAVKKARIKDGLEVLDELHPGWRDTVGKYGDDNDFRRWLATQPQAYQDRINNTDSPLVTKQALDQFQAAPRARARTGTPTTTTTQRPQQPARQARIAAAVQPKGSGAAAPGPQRNTARDEFHEGFNSG